MLPSISYRLWYLVDRRRKSNQTHSSGSRCFREFSSLLGGFTNCHFRYTVMKKMSLNSGYIIWNFVTGLRLSFTIRSMHLEYNVPFCLLFMRLVFLFNFHQDVLRIIYNGNLSGHDTLKGVFNVLDLARHLLFCLMFDTVFKHVQLNHEG